MNIINLGSGKCSYFGGSEDTGVGAQEGLSLIEVPDLQEWWFRRIFVSSNQWNTSEGLARNLNPHAFYCAMRWGFASFGGIQGEILQGYSREQIRRATFILSANGRSLFAQGSDWGPNTNTGRLLDTSLGCLTALDCQTNDIIAVSAII